MNEFLNLAVELKLDGLDYRSLVEGRAALQKAIADLQQGENGETRDLSTLSDEDGAKFDGYVERADLVIAEIAKREADERVEQRSSRAAAILAANGTTTPAGTLGAPLRAPEPAEERDIVANPDGSRYSLLRAIDLLSRNQPLDGYEAEISREMELRSGNSPQGFYVPFGLPASADPRATVEQRDFDVAAGAGLIQTNLAPRFIDALRNKMLLSRLGVMILDDLVGILEVGRQTGNTTGYWGAESAAMTESSAATGKITYTPTTVGAFTEVTRRMKSQGGSVSVENRVRNELLQTVAIELDRAGFNGSGSGAEPEGLLQNSSITTVAIGTNGGAMTWAKLVEMETEIAAGNAPLENLHYVTSSRGRGHLKTQEVASGTGLHLLQDGVANERPVHHTQQIPTDLTKGSGTALTAMLYGDFSKLGIGLWTGFDVLVDPHTKATSGDTRVVVLLDADIQVEQPAAFSKCVDIDPDA